MNGIEAAAAALGIPPANEMIFPDPPTPGVDNWKPGTQIPIESEHGAEVTDDEIAHRIQRKRDLRFLIAQARVEKLAIERQIVEFRRELASLKGKR